MAEQKRDDVPVDIRSRVLRETTQRQDAMQKRYGLQIGSLVAGLAAMAGMICFVAGIDSSAHGGSRFSDLCTGGVGLLAAGTFALLSLQMILMQKVCTCTSWRRAELVGRSKAPGQYKFQLIAYLSLTALGLIAAVAGFLGWVPD